MENLNWLNFALIKYYFSGEKDHERNNLPSYEQWSTGFIWKNVFVKIYQDYSQIKEEIMIYRKLHIELSMQSDLAKKYILPLISAIRYGTLYFTVTPCMNVCADWKKDANKFFDTYKPLSDILKLNENSPLLSKILAQNILPVDLLANDKTPKFLIINPKMLIKNTELNYLANIPYDKSMPIDIFYKIKDFTFEEKSLSTLLNPKISEESKLLSFNTIISKWDIQICALDTAKGKLNERINSCIHPKNNKFIKGNAIISCFYTRGIRPVWVQGCQWKHTWSPL